MTVDYQLKVLVVIELRKQLLVTKNNSRLANSGCNRFPPRSCHALQWLRILDTLLSHTDHQCFKREIASCQCHLPLRAVLLYENSGSHMGGLVLTYLHPCLVSQAVCTDFKKL